ncbi:MAG: exosome complex exonuclease Rrp41 [Nanoarchaeota archaeon]|nr:exosome complex exonuclease Rrp41 [Nanoarchaeota archaeon]MBU1644055.1 exosome complex exonuclease Rrp41 [Nanoarchaeota archaeon]MBU1977297.1 exosome complex exonuclease Rrp41 [Nanoarchaeota archaeon]
MAYTERLDKRKFDELRPMEAKIGVVKNAKGSASFKSGKTWAIAAVYGPREIYPKFLANPTKGILRCHYTMMPFSGSGERIRPGKSRRAQEISMVMEKALLPVVDLTDFPNSVVDVFVELPQTDAGTRCAAISAASMALAHAGIPMKDLVSSIAVGQVDGTVLADLSYGEESYPDVEVSDIPVAMLHNSKQISLLQMDGEISKKDLLKALEMAKGATEKVYELQVKALKEHYSKE